MATHKVTVWSVNVDADSRYEAAQCGIKDHGHFEFDSDKADPLELLDEIFALQNAEGNPSGNKILPNVCSMTAGDMVLLNNQAYFCASIGWIKVDKIATINAWFSASTIQRRALVHNAA